MLPALASERWKLNRTKSNEFAVRVILKFAREFQGRDV
jgi:hypothetical protein